MQSTANPDDLMRVAAVMTKAVIVAHEGDSFQDIARALIQNKISALPVVDRDRKVLGVISESDLLVRVAGDDGSEPWGQARTHEKVLEKAHGMTAAELMTSPAVTITANVSVAEAARTAATTRVRRLPVVDHDGSLIGIVSRGDFLRVYLRPDVDIRSDVEEARHGLSSGVGPIRLTPDH